MNRWVQGINLFHFTLIHVPGKTFRGPDALSRRMPASAEEIVPHDDSWVDDIALTTQFIPPYDYDFSLQQAENTQLFYDYAPYEAYDYETYDYALHLYGIYDYAQYDYVYFLRPYDIYLSRELMQTTLEAILEYLSSNTLPELGSAAATRKFLKKTLQFELFSDGSLFKKNGTSNPLRVILDV
jgi:hypothetical protein